MSKESPQRKDKGFYPGSSAYLFCLGFWTGIWSFHCTSASFHGHLILLKFLGSFLDRILVFWIAVFLERDPVQIIWPLPHPPVEILIFKSEKNNKPLVWGFILLQNSCKYVGCYFFHASGKWRNLCLYKHGCYIYLRVPLSVAFELTFGWRIFILIISACALLSGMDCWELTEDDGTWDKAMRRTARKDCGDK